MTNSIDKNHQVKGESPPEITHRHISEEIRKRFCVETGTSIHPMTAVSMVVQLIINAVQELCITKKDKKERKKKEGKKKHLEFQSAFMAQNIYKVFLSHFPTAAWFFTQFKIFIHGEKATRGETP